MSNRSGNQLLYRYLCTIRDCYQHGDFEPLFPLLDEDIVMESAWVLVPNVGRDNVMDYYRGKGPAIRGSTIPATYTIVELVHDTDHGGSHSPSQRARMWYPDGKLALYIVQYFPNEASDLIIDLTLTTEGKIGRIDLCIPGLF